MLTCTSHIRAWIALHTTDLQTHGLIPNPFTHAFETLPLVGSQWLDVDSHPCKSNRELIIALPEQHYNNPKHSCQVCFRWAMLPHPYKPLGLWASPMPHHQIVFCLFPKNWAKYIFSLSHRGWKPHATSDLHNFVAWYFLLSSDHFIDIYSLLKCR